MKYQETLQSENNKINQKYEIFNKCKGCKIGMLKKSNIQEDLTYCDKCGIYHKEGEILR